MDSITQFFYQRPMLIGIISFLIGLACMPVVLKVARTKHFVVKPNKRMSHKGSVPNIGGIDIFMSFLLSYLLFEYNNIQNTQYIFIGVFIVLMVGFVDDLIDLSPTQKLFGETIAAMFLLGGADVRLTHLHGFCGIEEIPLWSSIALSLFVFIVIINALNLIDGVDGLASGLGIVYCLFFAIYFQMVGSTHLAILAYCLIGSLSVFFLYNVFGNKNSKIFMGDSGSLTLGYMTTLFVFRFCELNAYQEVPAAMHISAAPTVVIGLMAVPLFDTLRVMLTRIKKGISPFSPDKNHIHHLLLRLGLTHIQVTGILISVTLLCFGIGLLLRSQPIWLGVLAVFAVCMLFTIILWRMVDRQNARELKATEKTSE